MKIKLKSFLLSFCLSISLILTSFSSFSQKLDINKLPKNSTIYLSSDSLKILYRNSGEFLQTRSKNDVFGNLIDPFGNKYILNGKKSSKELIDEIIQMDLNFYKIEEFKRIERYKAKRKELEQKIKFQNINNEFPIDIIPFGTNPGDDDDGDGVINTNDDDDDNDGILDVDEGLLCEVPVPLGVDGKFENFLATACSDGKNSNVTGLGWYVVGGSGAPDFSADSWIGNVNNRGDGSAIPDCGLNSAGGGCHNANSDCAGAKGGECNGLVPSPQGGVFVGGWCNDIGQCEAFRYDVPGLEVGKKYVVRFYQAHGCNEGESNVGDLGRWKVDFNGEIWNTPEVPCQGVGNQTWTEVDHVFTATAVTQTIIFRVDIGTDGVRGDRGDYMVIDDIKIFEQALEVDCTVSHTDEDGLPDHKDLDADGDGCFDVQEAGFTDNNNDGVLGPAAPTFDPANGRVTSGVDGYTIPANLDAPGNAVKDFLQVGGTLNVTDFPTKQRGGYTKATELIPGGGTTFSVTSSINLNCLFCDVDLDDDSDLDDQNANLSAQIVYQWQEKVGAGAWTNLAEGAPYLGVATSTLTINPTARSMAGNLYRAVVTNPSFICDTDVTTSDETYGLGAAAGPGQGLLIPNNCPVPDNDNYGPVDEEGFIDINDANGIKNGDIDADAEDDIALLPITIATPPAHGTLSCLPPGVPQVPDNGICLDGSFRYTNNGDEFITDSFTYTLKDGADCVSDVATVSFTITPINDVPLIVQDTYSVIENGSFTAGDVLGTDAGVADGVLVNDNDEDSPSCVGDCVIVPPATNLTATIFLPPSNGNISCPDAPGVFGVICSDGRFTYSHDCSDTPNQDFFTYTINDGQYDGPTRDTAFINIVNQPPVGVNDSYAVRKGGTVTISPTVPDTVSILANDTDPNPCDTLYFATRIPDNYPNYGVVNQFEGNGAFQYTHNCVSTEPRDTIEYVLNDGEDQEVGSTLIVLNVFDDVPIVNKDTFEVNEQDTLVVDLTKSILNNDVTLEVCDSIFAYKVTDPAHHDKANAGIFTLNTDGTFTYVHDCSDTPNQDFFVYMVRDGDGAGNFFHPNDSAILNYDTVFININNVCPVGEGDYYSVTEGGTVSIPELLGVLSNDEDDNTCETLTATLVTPPEFHDLDSGAFVLNPDGSFKYTHDHTENFIDEFSYTLSDGECDDAIYVATITIDSVADVPPVANADTPECVDEGGTLQKLTLATGVLGNDTDADAKDMPPIDTLEAILVGKPSNGTLDFKSDGTYTYVHNGGETILDSFTYYVTDGDFNSDTVLVTLCINPINDCPVPKDEVFFINEGDTIDSTLVFNDFDIEGDFLTTTLLTDTSTIVGTLALKNNGDFVYIAPNQLSTPAPGSEQVVLSYRLSDGVCDTLPPSTCTITIFAINDCPVTVDDTVTVDGKKTPVTSLINLIQNDSDIDSDLDTSSLTIQKLPKWGSAVLNGDGTVSYTYTGSPNKYDTLVYTIKDKEGCLSRETSLFISIDNLQYPNYTLPNYFTPNGDNFNDQLMIQLENIIIDNVKFEVLIMDRYQRKVFEKVVDDEMIWDGTNSSTGTEVKKDFYFYQIKPIEYGSTEGRDVVGVVFLDK